MNTRAGWGIFFLVAAAALCAVGIYIMYAHPYSLDRIASDELDYIIIATRGVGYICMGGVSAVIGCGLLLLSIDERLRGPTQSKGS